MIRLLALTCLLTTSFATNSATVIYDELISGDISNNGPSFNLVSGTSIIQGSAANSRNSSLKDADIFSFSIAPTQTVTGVRKIIQNIQFFDGASASRILTGSIVLGYVVIANGLDSGRFTLSSIPTSPITLAYVLPSAGLLPGNYAQSFFAGNTSLGGAGDARITYDYRYEFDVVDPSAVPVPAAAWLFISALGGLIVAKRKQLKA